MERTGNLGTEGQGARRLSPLLKLAIVSGAHESLRLQINRGADINAVDETGRSPLMIAAARGNFAICTILLEAGAAKDICDRAGVDALCLARAAGHERIIELLTPPPAAEAQLVPAHEPLPSMNDQDLDFGDWEVEDEAVIPETEAGATDTATEIQLVIASHEPIDDYAEWDDVELDLPDEPRTGHRRRADLTESDLTTLRQMLQEGLETGRVLLDPLLDRIYGTDEVSASEMRNRLEIVCGDLGLVLEARDSYPVSHAIADPPSEALDATLDEAMASLEYLGSRHTDPLFQFGQEMRRYALLTREDEQEIGREMELTEKAALLAFARHPLAVEGLVAIAEQVAAGELLLSDVTDTDPAPPVDAVQESGAVEDEEWAVATASVAELEEEDATADPGAAAAAFLALARDLKAAPDRNLGALDSLHLRWSLVVRIAGSVTAEERGRPESVELSAALRQVQVTRERLFHANLRLVFSVSLKYRKHGLPLADLVQEGCVGLMKAVERFEYRRGFKFSTYAMWWVRQAIMRALADQERLVRIPVHMVESINALNRITREHERKTGQEPSIAELAGKLGVLPDRIEVIKRIQRTVISIDDPDSDIPDLTVGDAITDPSVGPMEAAEYMSLQSSMSKLLRTIKPKLARIIIRRFGLDNDQDMTLEEVGKIFGVTRERIRQLESKALRQLRHRSRRHLLRGYNPELEIEASLIDEGREEDEYDAEASGESRAPSPSPAQTQSPRIDAAAVRTWADVALELATTNQLPFKDTRKSGGGLFIEFIPGNEQNHRFIQQKLSNLGFDYLTGRGFYRR